MDKRDEILQAHVPAIMVPRFGNLEPLATNGHRFLIAEDGVYIEVRRPWLHVVWGLTRDNVQLPYGPVLNTGISCSFEWDRVTELVLAFTRTARQQAPNECGAWIVWHEEGGLSLVDLEPIHAGPSRLKYRRPQIEEGLHLVCDIHSHGHLAAGFSATDDGDDLGEVKYAAVVGRADTDSPDFTMRLCLPAGVFIDASEWLAHG